MTEAVSSEEREGEPEGETRREFLYLATGAMGVAAVVGTTWPLVEAWNPSADVMALAATEVDLSPIEVGQSITVKWRGKPVFVRHRSEAEIEAAKAVDLDDLPDSQPDGARVIKPEWLVVIGICTHLGCIPLGQRPGDSRGDFGGWFCPCHGSHYDTSGRIRKGPAPRNLDIPEYRFLDSTTIRIG